MAAFLKLNILGLSFLRIRIGFGGSFSLSFASTNLKLRKMSMGEMNVGLPLSHVVKVLQEFAPTNLAEKWDNVGLLVEPANDKLISKIMLTNDLTLDVLDEALDESVDLILSYHPLIFSPFKRINMSNWKEKIVGTCLANNIAVYSPHTSWDVIDAGNTEWLKNIFDFEEFKPMFSNPPNETCSKSVTEPEIGIGRFGKLKIPYSMEQVITIVKKRLGIKFVQLALARNTSLSDEIKTIGFVAGSGGSFLMKLTGCDLMITGEASHHEVLHAVHSGCSVVLTHHSNSERQFLHSFKLILNDKLSSPSVTVFVSQVDKDPLCII